MSNKESILVIVDPTVEAQPAVERGMALGARLGMRVKLFISDYQPQVVGATFLNRDRTRLAKQQLIDQHLERLEAMAADFVDVEVETKAAWDHPLHESIVREALESDARYVLKDTHHHSPLERTFLTNTDWHLIRDCPMPLWLVKPDCEFVQPKLLAAVDPLHEHDMSAELDLRILSEACELADELGGIVNVFHAFNPFESPAVMDEIEEAHRSALRSLTDKAQIQQERVHLMAGNTTDLLPKTAVELGIDVVVMGAVSRSRLEYAIVGSTAETLLDRLPCDILVIKPKQFMSPVTFKSRPKGYYCAEAQSG